MIGIIKNIHLKIIILICVTVLFLTGCTNNNQKNKKNDVNLIEGDINKNTIEYTGWLKTDGAKLENEKGEQIQLRGISSHGIQWFSDILTYENLEYLKKEWNINLFRIAMYTDPKANGYIAQPEKMTAKVDEIIEYAQKLDIYVIVDWHILSDNNPQIYQQQSKKFFDELSKKYYNTPNVIYEICNEPNKSDVNWDNNVKPYGEEIIKIIRANSPRSLVIIGTPDWCKDLKNAADNPLNFENVLYSCHFYSGAHGEELQKEIDYCINKNIPVFVSECGITGTSGDGQIYANEFKQWINFLNEKNISWVFWSFCNKNESSSILTPEYAVKKQNENEINNNENNNETKQEPQQQQQVQNLDNYLTETGRIIKDLIKK